MKKLKLSIAMLSLLAVAACKKSSVSPSAVTTDDAADLVTASLSANANGGIADISGDVTGDANGITGFSVNSQTVNSISTNSLHCGETKTTTVTRASAAGATPSYTFTSSYTHTLNCNANQQPDNILTTGNFSGNYNGPHLTSAGSGSVKFTVGGLTSAATAYVINGEYKHSENYKTKPDTTKSGSSTIDLMVNGLTITKKEKHISGGTATLTITGTSKKGSFNFTGNVVFTGDDKATLTIGTTKYTIDLKLGEKIKL